MFGRGTSKYEKPIKNSGLVSWITNGKIGYK
jgi:hypothetical protein